MNDKAIALEQEKNRADNNAHRLAKMLERQILETAWKSSLDGDVMKSNTGLSDIASVDRGFALLP